ncbi:uncharacterized protein LOC133522543 [Cydia pomonella]|uniref:uncharacterized protein LOC133522543 n=1 Tax=Cydia pomonella TaxID=82600 RepID=UPI002ADD8AF1|nr:uncharacterized protein LOC133522543 [Cydia pomonella]
MGLSTLQNDFAIIAVFDGNIVTVFPKTERKSKWCVNWITETKFWYLDKDHAYDYREGIFVDVARDEGDYWKITSNRIEWLSTAFSVFPDPKVKSDEVHENLQEKLDKKLNKKTDVQEESCMITIENLHLWKQMKKHYPVQVRPINFDPNWPKRCLALDPSFFLPSANVEQSKLKEFSMEDEYLMEPYIKKTQMRSGSLPIVVYLTEVEVLLCTVFFFSLGKGSFCSEFLFFNLNLIIHYYRGQESKGCRPSRYRRPSVARRRIRGRQRSFSTRLV